ncbi:MAG TPA: glycine oxidase ThiO [Pyrinomonadaceae bacterium]|jgi:glycine oxidase|nr:glycine oxidase ThiO [Pyrinomonadaceae bacterium]
MFQTSETAQVAIMGGGVIGLAIARALALRGVRDVLLVERNSLGAESSSAAAGMLAPQAEANRAHEFFYLTCQSRDLYPEFAAALLEETGIDIELETTGTLYLAFTEHDADELEKRYEWQTRAGLPIEKLNAISARQLEPSINEDVRAALKFPLDTQVENRRLISALASANERLGVRMETGTAVTSLRIERDRITGIETSRGFIASDSVVIAGGAWSSLIGAADKALPNLRIKPVRGQMLCFEANPQIARHVIYSARGYIVPRRDGRLLAGSTTEHVGFEKRVTASGVHSILSTAMEISPRIAALPLTDSWAGLRPRAADTLPVLGPCAEIAGLFYATGHYRNGILLAPITGELIAGAIVDKVFPAALGIFSPDRFGLVTVS